MYIRLRKVLRLAGFIYALASAKRIARGQALNALDRLALKMDELGCSHAMEEVSAIYMCVYRMKHA